MNGFDVWRIARARALAFADFAELRWSDSTDGQHKIRLDDGGRRYRLLIRRVPEESTEHPVRCIFLTVLDATARCAIYDARPTMCQVYPSYLEDGLLGTSGGRYCPTGAWSVEQMDVPRLRALHRFKARQWTLYERLIEGWNASLAGARSQDELFAFLANAYGELTARRPEWFIEPALDDAGPSRAELWAAADAWLAALPTIASDAPARIRVVD